MRKYKPKKKQPKSLFVIILNVVLSAAILYILLDALNYYTYSDKVREVDTDIKSIQDVIVHSGSSRDIMNGNVTAIVNEYNNRTHNNTMYAVNDELFFDKADPWGNSYVILNYSNDSTGTIVIMSAGKDGKVNTNDDLKSTTEFTYGAAITHADVTYAYKLRSNNWYLISFFLIILIAVIIRNVNKISEVSTGWKVGWQEGRVQRMMQY